MLNLLPSVIKKLRENNFAGLKSVPILKYEIADAHCAFLVSSLIPNTPNFAYGIYCIDGRIEAGEIDLEELQSTEAYTGGIVSSLLERTGGCIVRDTTFVGEYPLDVYLDVAKELGFISTDYNRNIEVWRKHLKNHKILFNK